MTRSARVPPIESAEEAARAVRHARFPPRGAHPGDDALGACRDAPTRLCSGTDALVQLLLRQQALDRAAGLDTEGFVSGYRGSPLSGVDLAMWRASRELAAAGIRFEPGLNEELAATAVWGTQQIEAFGRPRCQGVFGLWYGKNPGLDRIGDVLKHANMDGTARLGGVLVAAGDDPGASSSTIANQGEQALIAAMSPVLYPSDVADLLELGLAGFAMSRYCGLWTGFKLVADVVESTATVTTAAASVPFRLPDDFEPPAGGLNRRSSDDRWAQDERALRFKLPAAQAFARANALDRTVVAPEGRKRIAFVAAGKAFRDLLEAFVMLGLDAAELSRLGVGVRKIALVWPLEDVANAEFLRGFEEVVAIEEKRAVIESQIDALTRHWPTSQRPRCCGKRDPQGHTLLPEHGEIGPLAVAGAVLERLAANAVLTAGQLAAIAARPAEPARRTAGPQRPAARAALLRRLSARARDPPAGRVARTGRDRLSFDGLVGPRLAHRHAHPDGWRRRQLDRRRRVRRHAARVPEPRRWHLLSLGAAGDPGRQGRRRVDHLQDPAQSGGGDDWRAAGRGRTGRSAHRLAIACRGGRAHRHRDRTCGRVAGRRPGPARRHAGRRSRRTRRSDARNARTSWRIGHRLRPDLRHRKATPDPARRARRGRTRGDHQRAYLRRLRRLLREVALQRRAARRDAVRAEAADRRVVVQYRPVVHRRLLPQLRDDRARRAAGRRSSAAAASGAGRAARAGARHAAGGPVVRHRHGGRRRLRAGDRRIGDRGRRSPRQAGGHSARQHRPGTQGRRGHHASAHRWRPGPEGRHAHPRGLCRSADRRRPRVGGLAGCRREVVRRRAGRGFERGDADAGPGDRSGPPAAGGRLPPAHRASAGTGGGCDDRRPGDRAARPRRHPLREPDPGRCRRPGRPAAGQLRRRRTGDPHAGRVGPGQPGRLRAWGRLAVADPGSSGRLLAGEPPAVPDDLDASDLDATVEFFSAELERYQDRRLADRYRALVGQVRVAEQAALGAPAGLARAVASHAFDALAAKDEYAVARLASDPRFLAELRARYGARARPVFHFAPAWLARRASATAGAPSSLSGRGSWWCCARWLR